MELKYIFILRFLFRYVQWMQNSLFLYSTQSTFFTNLSRFTTAMWKLRLHFERSVPSLKSKSSASFFSWFHLCVLPFWTGHYSHLIGEKKKINLKFIVLRFKVSFLFLGGRKKRKERKMTFLDRTAQKNTSHLSGGQPEKIDFGPQSNVVAPRHL